MRETHGPLIGSSRDFGAGPLPCAERRRDTSAAAKAGLARGRWLRHLHSLSSVRSEVTSRASAPRIRRSRRSSLLIQQDPDVRRMAHWVKISYGPQQIQDRAKLEGSTNAATPTLSYRHRSLAKTDLRRFSSSANCQFRTASICVEGSFCCDGWFG